MVLVTQATANAQPSVPLENVIVRYIEYARTEQSVAFPDLGMETLL